MSNTKTDDIAQIIIEDVKYCVENGKPVFTGLVNLKPWKASLNPFTGQLFILGDPGPLDENEITAISDYIGRVRSHRLDLTRPWKIIIGGGVVLFIGIVSIMMAKKYHD